MVMACTENPLVMVNALQEPNGPVVAAPPTLTVRMIMQGKEVGSIIGKKGDNVKKYREISGAKINITDGTCPERIVTVNGTVENIYKAFDMICSKFEEDLQSTPTVLKPPITLRMVVPASQCGSLIGKGGIRIKEIRETTGASIQVASDMLPNSTERAVTVSGTAEAITLCIKFMCNIMLETPPKGTTIPYRPKPIVPFIYPGQPFPMPPQMAVPPQEMNMNKISHIPVGQPLHGMHVVPHPMVPGIAYARHPGLPALPAPPQTSEMVIPKDLIGCIIGRKGQKIHEIRQISGATIKIADSEEGSPDRRITISGAPETISTAHFLINSSMDLHKTLTLDPTSTLSNGQAAAMPLSPLPSPFPYAVPYAPMIKPALSPISGPLTGPMTGPITGPMSALQPMNPITFYGFNGLNGGAFAGTFNGCGFNGFAAQLPPAVTNMLSALPALGSPTLQPALPPAPLPALPAPLSASPPPLPVSNGQSTSMFDLSTTITQKAYEAKIRASVIKVTDAPRFAPY